MSEFVVDSSTAAMASEPAKCGTNSLVSPHSELLTGVKVPKICSLPMTGRETLAIGGTPFVIEYERVDFDADIRAFTRVIDANINDFGLGQQRK